MVAGPHNSGRDENQMQEISTCPRASKTEKYEVVVALLSDMGHEPVVIKAIIVDAESEEEAADCALKKAEGWIAYDERIHPVLVVWSTRSYEP